MRSIMQTPNVNNINKVLKSMNIENVKINNAPNYIQDIVAKLEKAQNRTEMYKILDDAVKKTSDFLCIDDTKFVGNGYKFQCTLSNYVKNINLNNARCRDGCELIKIIPIADSGNTVILTKMV